jgi:hypothetical protein
LPAAADQEPVEAVSADGADEAFGERLCPGRAKGGTDDLDALASEDLVEGAAELAFTVVDQEASRCRALGERPRKLSGLLGCPAAVGVRGAACEVHAPAAELKEEEDIEAPEPERLDGKKSQAIIELACAHKESRQLTYARALAWHTPACRRIFATVVAETRMPIPASSPTIRW